VHLLVCYLNKIQNARCNDKDVLYMFLTNNCPSSGGYFSTCDLQYFQWPIEGGVWGV